MSTPSPKINGNLGVWEQPVKYGNDTDGDYVIREWHGTTAALESQAALAKAAGGICEVQAGIVCHKLTARFSIPGGISGSGEEVPINNWEFFASHVEKDFLEVDRTFSPALTTHDESQIRELMANPKPDSEIPAWDNATGSNLYALYRRGVRSVIVDAPALRHTQTVSNLWTVKAALTNVGRVITSGTLITSESVPSSVLFNLPYDTLSRTVPGGAAYGWRKGHPTIRTAARQKMQIEQEWAYGLWSTLLYGAAL